MDDDNPNGLEVDKIQPVKIEEEMRESFIEYAMSVIVARALPDVRDGLKPVHRRILHAMNEMGLEPNKGYKKSARITGDTMGKYHPHGESSIYDAMVRMAQDFSMRYMLVDGHGNFGSMDGDKAAAQRYTEARLSRLAVEMLADIEKNTVDFVPNYDEELTEPTVLPARLPNLLVNGSAGIAVGMATNIPPHNLSEVIDAIVKVIDNHIIERRETDIEEIIPLIKGPDFPTGATILGKRGIKQAYRTGRGKVLVRAEAAIEVMPNGREMIVVTEIPYQINKARLVEKIGELVKDKRIEGISDLRDESNRNGVRIVIEIKKDANANVILNQLYKYSPLQESFGINMLALVHNEPKLMNILEVLTHYIEHQKEVVTRRTVFDLEKALKRAHILEGYLIALDNIDEVISIIRSSADQPSARAALVERFNLSEEQARAIVEMRLGSLTGLERGKVEKEYAELKLLIEELRQILNDENRLYTVIREEILIIKAKYGDERRTKIVAYDGEIDLEDLIEEETSVITLTHLDYIKRLPLTNYKSQKRGGKGIMGMQMRDEDIAKRMFVASTHDTILYFTSFGKVYRTKAYDIPETGRMARGMALVNLLNLDASEKVAAVIPVSEFNNDEYLLMVTKKGIAKRTSMAQFSNIMKKGLIALSIREDDELISVLRTSGKDDILLATKKGMGIRFTEEDIRAMGRMASGVKAITLADDDEVISAEIMAEGSKVLLVSQGGYGKCTELLAFRMQKRGGKGLKIYKITEKTGELVSVNQVNEREELMIINSEGIIIRIRIRDISTMGRITQGVKLINLNDGVAVVSAAKIAEDLLAEEQEEEKDEPAENPADFLYGEEAVEDETEDGEEAEETEEAGDEPMDGDEY